MTNPLTVSREAPAHLSEQGKACYDAISMELSHLSKLHQPEMEMAAEAYSTWQTLSAEKSRQEQESVTDTYIYHTSNGNQAPSALVKMMTEARDCYIALLEKLRVAAAAPPPHPDMFKR